jgi:hypothetical protein
MSLEDYSLYTIRIAKLTERIYETANRKQFEKATELAFVLNGMTDMLHESLKEMADKQEEVTA